MALCPCVHISKCGMDKCTVIHCLKLAGTQRCLQDRANESRFENLQGKVSFMLSFLQYNLSSSPKKCNSIASWVKYYDFCHHTLMYESHRVLTALYIWCQARLMIYVDFSTFRSAMIDGKLKRTLNIYDFMINTAKYYLKAQFLLDFTLKITFIGVTMW